MRNQSQDVHQSQDLLSTSYKNVFLLSRKPTVYQQQDRIISAFQNRVKSKQKKEGQKLHKESILNLQLQDPTNIIETNSITANIYPTHQELNQANPYTQYIQSNSIKRTNFNLLRNKRSEAIRLPILNRRNNELSASQTNLKQPQRQQKQKDYGLTDEEKHTYQDRFPINHTRLDILGKGGFAIVWMSFDNRIGQKIALKQISKSAGNTIFDRERRFYQHFFHNRIKAHMDGYDNLIEILGIEQTHKDIWISQELGGKTLSKSMYNLKGEFFKGERVYSITETDFTQEFYKSPLLFIQLLKDIAKGIELIHSQGFTHCDLKPENILIVWNDETKYLEQVKIIDYGSSFTLNDKDNIGMVTPEYMAPEVLEIIHNWSKYQVHYPSQIDALKSVHEISNVDIWSYGAVILDMICGIPHWLSYKGKIVKSGKTMVRTGLFSSKGRELDKIMQKQGLVIKQIDQIVNENAIFLSQSKKIQLIDLLQQILLINPQQRATPSLILNHQFFCC